jgi:hypothetical protein
MQAKDAHHSVGLKCTRRDGGPHLQLNELRMAGPVKRAELEAGSSQDLLFRPGNRVATLSPLPPLSRATSLILGDPCSAGHLRNSAGIVEFSDERRAIAFEKYLRSGSGSAFARRHLR